MNRVLVPGLGSASDLGICASCNLNFSWLLNNLSSLLWVDEICVPQKAYQNAKTADEEKADKVISLFLGIVEDEGLIYEVDLTAMYQRETGDNIYTKMLSDSTSLIKNFPNTIRIGDPAVPDELIIEDYHYCGARMASICLDVKLAGDLGANCLFGKSEHTYLKYLYGLNLNTVVNSGTRNAYSEIFSLYLPENLGVHQYAFWDEEYCLTCKKYERCNKQYLGDTEDAIRKMLTWRNYDELHQAKEEIDKIIRIKGQISSENDIADVVKEFKEKQDRINRNINKRFPQIKRWTKMTTVLATPITIAAAVTGNTDLVVSSAVLTGVSQAAERLLEIYESKNNWVGFINSMKEM